MLCSRRFALSLTSKALSAAWVLLPTSVGHTLMVADREKLAEAQEDLKLLEKLEAEVRSNKLMEVRMNQSMNEYRMEQESHFDPSR